MINWVPWYPLYAARTSAPPGVQGKETARQEVESSKAGQVVKVEYATMTSHNDSTGPDSKKLHPTQTLDAAKEAGKLFHLPHPPIIAEEDRETVYLETGAGLALTIDNVGRFSMHPLARSGRASVELTAEETKALYHFWWSICAPGILESLPAAVALVKAQRTKEDDHGNI
jgi:hypothetical protein